MGTDPLASPPPTASSALGVPVLEPPTLSTEAALTYNALPWSPPPPPAPSSSSSAGLAIAAAGGGSALLLVLAGASRRFSGGNRKVGLCPSRNVCPRRFFFTGEGGVTVARWRTP